MEQSKCLVTHRGVKQEIVYIFGDYYRNEEDYLSEIEKIVFYKQLPFKKDKTKDLQLLIDFLAGKRKITNKNKKKKLDEIMLSLYNDKYLEGYHLRDIRIDYIDSNRKVMKIEFIK